jgi:hypothetical protein
LTGDELPYTSTVVIDKFDEEEGTNLRRIAATIVVERDAHKGMVIGDGASASSASAARRGRSWKSCWTPRSSWSCGSRCARAGPTTKPACAQPLLLTYTLAGDGAGDIHTLKGAEWVGGHVMPTGDALLSGLYLNELLLRLLARADAHAGLFDVYAGVVRVLASEHGDALEPVLRSFELLLLRDLGLLPTLDAETATLANLRPEGRYTLVAEGGLRTASQADRASLAGSQWRALQEALDEAASYTATLRACAPWRPNSNPSCGRCCNTIAAARCCAPASS